MYPEDTVLVAYVPDPDDFAIIRRQRWYRIPQDKAPKGLHAEYIAFYFGQRFGSKKWAIHYYAQQQGIELARRVDLLPDQPNHPRAENLYYRVALGPIQELEQPITSLRWRRITFIHTTWDRFTDAREINDLLLIGGSYVDRLFYTLRDKGISVERDYEINEGGVIYRVPLSIQLPSGRMNFSEEQMPSSDEGIRELVQMIERHLT